MSSSPRPAVAAASVRQIRRQEALRALEAGPLDAKELERMRRIGDPIYGRHQPKFADRGDRGATQQDIASG